MTAKKRASRRSSASEMARVDAHVIQPHEYDELPELTGIMLKRGKLNKGGRPPSANPRRLISIRLPKDVIERWRATGPGWQTRMAERLAHARRKLASRRRNPDRNESLPKELQAENRTPRREVP